MTDDIQALSRAVDESGAEVAALRAKLTATLGELFEIAVRTHTQRVLDHHALELVNAPRERLRDVRDATEALAASMPNLVSQALADDAIWVDGSSATLPLHWSVRTATTATGASIPSEVRQRLNPVHVQIVQTFRDRGLHGGPGFGDLVPYEDARVRRETAEYKAATRRLVERKEKLTAKIEEERKSEARAKLRDMLKDL